METIEGLTYATLEEALLTLGFTLSSDEHARVYLHAGGALIALPPVNIDDNIRRNHLFSATATVNDFGLMDRRDFDFLLLRLAPSVQKVAA